MTLSNQSEMMIQSASPVLARMNKRLIEDEGSSNPMSIEELVNRFQRWLNGDWNIDLLYYG